MKKEKTASKEWVLAIVHLLTAAFIIPYPLIIMINIPVFLIVGTQNINTVVFCGLIAWIFSVTIGVLISAKLLNNKYLITDSNKISNLATLYFVLINLFFLSGSFFQDTVPSINIQIWLFVLKGFIFYSLCRLFLKNNSQNEIQK